MTASNDVTLKSETTIALPEALLAEGESISDAQIERAIRVIDAELYESPSDAEIYATIIDELVTVQDVVRYRVTIFS